MSIEGERTSDGAVSFARSSELHLAVGVKQPKLRFRAVHHDTAVRRLQPLTVHAQTPSKHFKNGRIWNHWLSLPVRYSTLPVNTQLAITIWDLAPIAQNDVDSSHHIPFGGTTIPLFDEDATLRTGRQKCKVWRHKAADGFTESATPWQERRRRGRQSPPKEPVIIDARRIHRDAELERLVDLMKRHEMGDIPENKWLDQMVFRQIEKLDRRQTRDLARPAHVPRPSQGHVLQNRHWKEPKTAKMRARSFCTSSSQDSITRLSMPTTNTPHHRCRRFN
ncbi:hypothetical protein MRB53_041999 [Persea americana]|nr:hypothetical protein MRB53_041999 [Persea americana]